MRQVKVTAPIVVTLSPVPLEATFRDISSAFVEAFYVPDAVA